MKERLREKRRREAGGVLGGDVEGEDGGGRGGRGGLGSG